MTNFLDRTGIRIIKPLLKWYLEDENLLKIKLLKK